MHYFTIKFLIVSIGSDADKEPIYTNGRMYFNLTGDICNKETKEKFNLVILLLCDYSSEIQKPTTISVSNPQLALLLERTTTQTSKIATDFIVSSFFLYSGYTG